MLTGLLFGAGASYECGMPLVWELTKQIRDIATPQMLRKKNESSRRYGTAHPPHLVEYEIDIIRNPNMHYESVIGNLHLMYKRKGGYGDGQNYHGLATDLQEIVYWILYERHKRFSTMIEKQMRFFDGFNELAKNNSPFWVFSLNHDLLVECMAAYYDIPINCGFSEESCLPLPENSGNITQLKTTVMPEAYLKTKGMPFFRSQIGINLFKLHGSLDIFHFNDERDYLKLVPIRQNVSGVLESLFLANELLPYKFPLAPEIRATNQIIYLDQHNKIQFLERSILTGAFKFSENWSNQGSLNLLNQFRSNLNYLSNLVVVGYGFGDSHVNSAIRQWLEFSENRHLRIIDPKRHEIPGELLHVAPQIALSRKSALEFFDEYAARPLSQAERAMRDAMISVRAKQA